MAQELEQIEDTPKVIDKILKKVNSLVEGGQFRLPADYAAENAVRAAYFIIGDTVDKDKKPALQVCKPDSVAEAIFRMVMQGLDPTKSQCYFIVNGDKLSLRRSYMGAEVVARRVAKVIDVAPAVIFDDDGFEYEVVNGRFQNIVHKSKIQNMDNPISGAYCIVTFEGGEQRIDIMTIKQIKESWKMSQNQTNNKLQSQFGPEAAKRTIINRVLKPIINTSNDANLYQKDFTEDTEPEDITHEVVSTTTAPKDIPTVSLSGARKAAALPESKIETIPVTEVRQDPQPQEVPQQVTPTTPKASSVPSNDAKDW